MSTLKEVWHEVEKLLEEGISVIPVRDKDDDSGIAKSPFKTWKKYQEQRITKEVLWYEMKHFNTCAIGILGGRVSGNLYIIDIDVKYKPGIDALLFQDLKKLYPDVFEKLRIHKSPSGGYHIIYRCEREVEGNLKLAGRPATEQELKERPKNKVYNFLETRGEGGYVLAPPSMGYKVVKDNPIAVLTLAEHQSIINLCRSYNEIVKIEKTYKPTKAEESYYDENPFDDFNNRCDPSALMSELGWQELDKHSDRFIWFTRPGKSKGISMSFNLQKRVFFCFTASMELEENHGYTPSNLVSTILHGGDKKKTYAWLVQHRYGKVKPKIEAKQVKQKILKGEAIPANFSEEARTLAATQAEELQELHPYGIFWEPDEEGKILISREALYQVANGLGFRFYEGQLFQVIDKFIYKRNERFFFDTVKNYIKENDGDLYEDICNSYESFIQKNGKFSIERLQLLLDTEIVVDTRTTCNKFFLNGFLEIDAESASFRAYSELNGLVFYERVQHRFYAYGAESIYKDFLQKATGITDHIKKTIGFLAHEYKDETMAYIIVLTETCPDPKQGGGSGKNVFCELLKYTTSYAGKPGTRAKFDEKFFQSWNGERVFAISDIDKDFDFSVLKEAASGSIIVKKLWVNETIQSANKSPKLIVLTNFSYEISDGGLKRRIIPIEFSDFFTNAGGLDVHYGKHFPNDWSETDWNGYDTFISECVQLWLRTGRKLSSVELSETGWEKQFKHEYSVVIYDLINEYWKTWTRAEEGVVTNEDFKTHLETYYVANSISVNHRPSVVKINRAIEAYAKKHGYVFEKDAPHRPKNELGVKKVRKFYEQAPF